VPTPRARLVLAGALALLPAAPGLAAADEARTPVSASMVLSIMSQPPQTRQSAFDESLRRDGPPPPSSSMVGEVQPDGSVRYGRAVVTVKNPCPPQDHEPRPLPGRRDVLRGPSDGRGSYALPRTGSQSPAH
jgi:hypothetical protein